MKTWRIRIEINGVTQEVFVEAALFSDAYVAAELKFPGAVVKGVSEVRNVNDQENGPDTNNESGDVKF